MSEETKNTTEAGVVEHKAVGTKLFTITPEGKEAIMQILSTKPFNTVLVMANLLEKPEFTEDEANQIINFIGAYPYGEVVTFFGRLKEYFVESSTGA